MKNDIKFLSELRKQYGGKFESEHRSLHDLLWQIAINGMLDMAKEPVLFHVNVCGEFGNELVLAFTSGGYNSTGVYFKEGRYDICCDIAEELNSLFFQIDKDEQVKFISKSMQSV